MSLDVSFIPSHLGQHDKVSAPRKKRGSGLEPIEVSPPKLAKVAADLIFQPHEKPIIKDVKTKKAIGGRAKEAHQVIRLLSDPKGRSKPLLLGLSDSDIKHVLQTLKNHYKERPVIIFDCQKFLGDEAGRDSWSEVAGSFKLRMETIAKECENPVICFRNIDLLLKTDVVKEAVHSVLTSNIPCLASVLKGEGTQECLEKLAHMRYQVIEVGELGRDAVIETIVEKCLKEEIKIGGEAIQLAVSLAGKFMSSSPLPGSALQLIRESSQELKLTSKRKEVKAEDLAQIVSEKTKIPPNQILSINAEYLDTIKKGLKNAVIGQDDAIETVFQAIKRYRTGVSNPNRPWGVFLFAGPTGVGKTKLAEEIAKQLFFDKKGLAVFDMAEFSESHTISGLIGAPSGYVGYDEGGKLTTHLKEHPHAVILLDEFEKAHPNIIKLFLGVFDAGRLTDGKGRTIDCTNAIFIMTSNLGAQKMVELSARKHVTTKTVKKHVVPLILENLSPELYNRLTEVVLFQSLNKEHYVKVVENTLKEINVGCHITWTQAVATHFANLQFDSKLGVRPLSLQTDIQVRNFLADHRFEKDIHLDIANGHLILKK